MIKLNRTLRLIAFPGSYIKAFWEKIFANLLGITVINPSFLSGGNADGHIVRGKARRIIQLMLYNILPGFACAVTGLPLFVFGFLFLGPLGAVPVDGGLPIFILAVFALYIGASLMSSIYPSIADANELWERLAGSDSKAAKLLGYPPALIARIGAQLESHGICALFYFGVPAVYFLVYAFGKI